MDIGTGIALAGVWLMVGAFGSSKNVSSFGMWLAICIGVGLTIYLK